MRLRKRKLRFESKITGALRGGRSISLGHTHANFGDDLSLWIVNRVFQASFKSVRPEKDTQQLLALGSIAHFAGIGATVWGAGLLRDEVVNAAGAQFGLIRGPLSRDRIREAEVPAIYGDPGLLVGQLAADVPSDKGHSVVLPHYADLARFREMLPGHKIIDIRLKSLRTIIGEIAGAAVVVSSSLHGLIVAQSFGKPIVWVEPGPGVHGGRFKFLDHFAALDIDITPHSLQEVAKRFDSLAVQHRIPDTRRILRAASRVAAMIGIELRL